MGKALKIFPLTFPAFHIIPTRTAPSFVVTKSSFSGMYIFSRGLVSARAALYMNSYSASGHV